MDNLIVSAFREGTKVVLKTISGAEPEVLFYSAEDDEPITSFISGTIGLTGPASVSILFGFTKEAIYKLHLILFPEEKGSEVTFSALGNLVGEMTNMIAGQAKSILADNGMRFEATIPNVKIGDRQYPQDSLSENSSFIPFSVSGEVVFVEVSVEG